MPGREAEEEARRWPALMAVLWRVMSFSLGCVSSGGRAGLGAGGGDMGAMAELEGGERWPR